MRRGCVSSILVLLASAVTASPQTPADLGLVVHEWGTFTSVVEENGLPMEWRPFGRPSDLPAFVYSARADGCDVGPPERSGGKQSLRALVRLETPVVYFYAKGDAEVSARVSFHGGRLTEWYPWARSAPSELAWERVHVWPGAAPALLDEGDSSRYYAARATDAASLAVDGADGTQHERFLFYRGVGRIEPPLSVTLRGQQVTVSDYATSGVSEVVLFENRGGRIGYVLRTKKGPQATLRRDAAGGTLESLRRDLEAILVGHGLYPKEAAAMVETWGDSWFEEGTRVFYVVPQPMTEGALPLDIQPRPSRTVRVMVARTEILTPERLASLADEVRRLSDADLSEGAARERVLDRLGRFAEPGLHRLLVTAAGEGPLRARIQRLLAGS